MAKQFQTVSITRQDLERIAVDFETQRQIELLFDQINELLVDGGLTADIILTDTTNFDGALSASDINVQVSLDTLDEASKTYLLIDGSKNGVGSQQFQNLVVSESSVFNSSLTDQDFTINGIGDLAYFYEAGIFTHRWEGNTTSAFGFNQASPDELMHLGDNNDSVNNFFKVQTGGGLQAGLKFVGGSADIWTIFHDDSRNNMIIGLNSEEFAQFTGSGLTINPQELDFDFSVNRTTANGGGYGVRYNAGTNKLLVRVATEIRAITTLIPTTDGGTAFRIESQDEDRTMTIVSPVNGDNDGPFIFNTNNSFAFRIDGDVEYLIDQAGNHIFNQDQNDRDFTINKNNSGEAMKYDSGDDSMTFGANTINMANLPTSATGLNTGDLWNDSGTLKIA